MTWIQLAYLSLAAVIAFASQWTTGAVQHGMLAIPAFMLGHMTSVPQFMTAGKSTGKSLPPVAIVLSLFLVGCSSFYSETNDAINTTAVKVNQAAPAIQLLCQADPGQRCDDARKAYEVAGGAVAAAHDALEVYRVTGAGIDEVGKALRAMADSAREVVRVVTAE